MAGDPLSRAAASAADEADPLGAFRDRFVAEESNVIYLDGNSLGRLPVATRRRLGVTAADWGERLVRGWLDWIDTPVGTGDLLAEHDRLVRAALARHRGREIKSVGDGFLALFDGPARAVRAARSIVADVTALGLEVRAGVHAGEVELVDETPRAAGGFGSTGLG